MERVVRSDRFLTVHCVNGKAIENTFDSFEAAYEFVSVLSGLQGVDSVELVGIQEVKETILRMGRICERKDG